MQQAYPTTWKDTIYYFVEDVSTSLRCPIHKGLFNKPVIASCGHTFCQSCILSFLDNSEEPECPIDHSSLKESGCLIPNLAVEGQIQDLYVYCKYSLKMVDNTMVVDPAACNKKVRLSNWQEHEENCDFAIVTCAHCNEEIRRKDFGEHNKKCSCCPCPHAKAGCDFSGQDGDVGEHLKNCQYEKIKGFISKSEQQWNDMREFMKAKEEESARTQETLHVIQQQLEQLLSTVEAHNGRTESALRFLTNSVDELKIQVAQNCADIADIKKSPSKVHRLPSNADVGSPALLKNAGHVPGVPGLNITCHGSFTGHSGPVWALAATESLLISGSSDATVKIWELATSACKLTLTGHEGIVHAVAVNNRHVISGSSDKLLKVWDIDTGKCLRTLAQHENTVCSLFVGGGYIFSGSFNEIKVWNPHTYEEEHTLRGHNHWVRAIAIHDRTLYSGSHNIIKVWNLDTFQCTGTITAQCGSIYSLAFAGNRLLAGTFENLIYVWERDTFRCVATLHGHFGAVYNLCVSGDRLYSASYDTSIRVWSLDTLRCIQTIGHHSSSVEALILWGGILFSGSADATIKVWR